MEVIKRTYIRCIVCVICIASILLSGCGKKWYDDWEENYSYISDEPYIYIPIDHEKAVMEIDGEKRNIQTTWSFDGIKIFFYNGRKRDTESIDLIWETQVLKYKKGKLYLKIVKDNCGNDEGKEIVLEKRLKEE